MTERVPEKEMPPPKTGEARDSAGGDTSAEFPVVLYAE
jgi:hypothetical protein